MSAAAVLRRPRDNAATLARYLQAQLPPQLQFQRRAHQASRKRPDRSTASFARRPYWPSTSFFRSATASPDLFDATTRVHKLPPTAWARVPVPHSILASRKDGREIPVHESLVDDVGAAFHTPMLNWIQVVSVPTADTPGACVLMHFDNRRYIFGHMSEGTQRAITQRKLGLAKLDELFLSGPVTWRNAGGLFGMILTIADIVATQNAPLDSKNRKKKNHTAQNPTVIPSLKIYAAENINHMLATARKFIFRKGMPLRLTEISHDAVVAETREKAPDFEDANVRVWYVSLKPDGDDAAPHGRKRSHDDMVAEDKGQSSPKQTAEQKQSDRDLVNSVVNNMFDSNWELDALVETTLHRVSLPAAIFVKGEDGQVKKYDGPMPGGKAVVPDIPVLTRTPWPATKITELPRTSPSRQSLSYIVKAQPRRGRFNIEEANRLGVPKNQFTPLTQGKTVKGKDGIDVTPEMVVGAAIEGHGMAFIDLPDTSYIAPFLARPEWTNEAIMNTIDVMYWNLGRGVVHDERIQAFMKQHEKKWHEVFSPDVTPNGAPLSSTALQLIAMHMIDPDRFSLPVYDNKPRNLGEKPYNVARVGHKVQLAPRVEAQDDEITSGLFIGNHLLHKSVKMLAARAREELSHPAFLEEIRAAEQDIAEYRDVEIIPLGTGSALPSKYRNVSATLVRVPGYGAYLFDCGENTLGQLRRMYGAEKADDILSELKVIWISHLHADHHLGTASVIKAWRDATTPKLVGGDLPRLTVASHQGFTDWLREYADVEDYGFDRLRLVTIRGPAQRETVQEPVIFNPSTARETGLTRIDAVRVDHCHGALACVLTWPNGLRVAYSGDCRPSRLFAEVAEGCTLLLHEATLDDELRGDAFAKKHCTMSEALDIARRMRARRVMLTHFSQRYPKIANEMILSGGEGQVKDQVVLMAFDQMHVKLGDFRKAELFLPAIRNMLDYGADDD